MNRNHIKRAVQTLKNNPDKGLILLIECWNSEKPHFGNFAPHRYDGASKTCSYCNRPKDWINANPALVLELLSDLKMKVEA